MAWSREKSEALMAQFLPADSEVDAKERKRRRIVSAAANLFLRLGYRKTAIDDVARTAGVAKGTVYLYFSSKAELLLHAVVAEKAPFADTFINLMEDPDPRRRLWRYVHETVCALRQMPLTTHIATANEFQVALSELDADLASVLTEQRVETLQYLLSPFVNEDAPQDLQDRTAMLAGLLRTTPTVLAESVAFGMHPDRAARALADALVDGLTRPTRDQEIEKKSP
jgi:AcrR family transcriptional regulator